MKRKLGFLMTLVIALCTSSAWAQSVVSVGTNLDFSEGTPVDNGICTYAKDIESNGTTYSQMLEVTGWTIEGENGDARAAGLFAYGSGNWLGSKENIAPATNPEGAAEGNALGVVAVWDAVAQYVQPVTLEAGNYVINIPVYNSVGGTTAPAKSLIGFIADNGTEYLAPAKAYAVNAWTVETITFTLTETTTGKLSLGYDAPNSGSGANQHLFFDKVEIMAVTETDLARADLDAVIATAQATVDAKAGVGAGLFMYSEEAYNTYAAAVAAAKAVSENAEATKDDLVAALAALNAATEAYVVTAPAADAVYTLKFNGTENYLTIGESNITIEATDDPLSFEAVGNGKYYIHDKEGKYLSYAGTNKWTMTASADVKDEWAVSVNAEGLYTLTGKNGGLGVDGTEAGSSCYGDKNGSAVALWTIAEIVIEEEPIVDPNDYTSYIVNADLSTTDAWNAEGTKGISGGMVKVGSGSVFDFSQTITLPAGQYKMTAQAAYRYSGAEQSEYEAILAGTQTHYAKLYAETADGKVEVNVQNRWEGASETDYVANEGSATVNNLFVPNSSAAVKTWFDNGKYVNELVFNVYEDGQVKIGIAKTETPEVGDYVNIGAWTLTRLGDAVEETPEEPEVPALIVWNINPADYTAGTQYAIDEAHVVNDTLTIYTTQMHWTTQLRVYSSSEHNGFFYSNKLPAAIKSIEFTAGNKKDVLVVYGSNDGATWTEAAKVEVPSTSYTTGLVADLTGTAYNYFKVDVEGNQQVRISNLIITLDPAVELPKVVAAPSFSLSGCNLFAPATVELTAAEGTIYWSTDNENFVAYTEPIAIEATCTVYAYAEVEGSKSVVASAEYVMATTYDNVAALLAAEATSAGVPVIVKLEATVDSLGLNKSGEVTSAFLVEGTDTLMIYDYNIPADYVVGNKVKGQLAGLWKDYKGTLELCNVDYSSATAAAPVTVESPWVGTAIENGKTYYLYNVKANAFMKGGNSWGTQASFGEDAVAFTAEGNGNLYGLKSTYGSYLGDGLYVDQGKKEFVFDEVGEGIYTIAKDGAYIGYDGGNIVVTAAEVNDGSYWQLLTKESIVTDMVAADATTPYHVTALITCANFGRNDQSISAWTGGPDPAGDNDNFCAEKWNAGISVVSQTLTGLPNGTYRLQAQGLYRMGGVDGSVALRDAGQEIYDVKFFANTDSVMVMSVMDEAGKLAGVGDAYGTYGAAPNNRNHASRFFNAGYYEHSLYFTVTDGTAVIGVANNTGVGGDWLVFDNFRMTYYGTASVEDVMLAVPRQEFVARYAAMEAFSQEELNYAWNGINNNYFWPVMDAAMVIKDTIDNVTDMALLDSMMTEMDNAEAMVLKAYVLGDEYNKVKNLFWDASDNSTAISDEARMAMEAALENSNYASYTIATIEDLEAAIVDLKAEYIAYVGNATPVEGFLFDVTCMFANPSFDAGNINGWTAAAGWQFQSNQVYTGEGAELNKFQERWVNGTGLGNTSTMQALANMPNGAYRISADIMATAQYDADPKGHTTGAYWVANTDSVAVATANGTPERYTVETTVVDGNLTIGLVGVNTTANWMGLDNVTIEYCGAAPADPCLKTIEVNLVDVKVGDWTVETVVDAAAMAEITELLGAKASELTYQLVDTTGVHSNYNGNAGEVLFWVDLEGNLSNWGVNNKFFISYDSIAPAITTTQYGVSEGDVLNATVRLANAEGQYVEIKITESIYVSPIINIADFEVVSTIKVEHVEEAGVAYSGNTAAFDAVAVAEALGVASLADAEQYILNVTTGNLVANTTDGWRDVNGDAAGWGNDGGVCVKIQDPASGIIDYIGCYDTTHAHGEVYTAKWAFVYEGKAVVIEVVIIFETDGIENIEAAEDAVIYTITGKRVQGNVKSLESGIYIVNGRKVLVK